MKCSELKRGHASQKRSRLFCGALRAVLSEHQFNILSYRLSTIGTTKIKNDNKNNFRIFPHFCDVQQQQQPLRVEVRLLRPAVSEYDLPARFDFPLQLGPRGTTCSFKESDNTAGDFGLSCPEQILYKKAAALRLPVGDFGASLCQPDPQLPLYKN